MQARLWINREQVQLYRCRFDAVHAQLHAAHAHTPAIGRYECPSCRFEQACVQVAGIAQYSLPLYTNTIGVLEFLFLGSAPPPCPDAADATDEAQITITSAVYVLNFLFGGGPAILPPYPNCGDDPTNDALGECLDPEGACS